MDRIDITRYQLDKGVDVFRSDGFDPLLEVVDIQVERIDVELDGGEFVDT